MSGLIPRDFIQELLVRIDIVELINTHVPLKKAGRNYQACCPFHTEKSPSFTVSAGKQFYYCFGCGASGNALSFVMAWLRLDFVSAVEMLAQQAGLPIPRTQSAHTEQKDSTDAAYALLQQAAKFYRQQLKHSSAAIQYLQQRGLTGEIAKRYAIGYAPAQWDSLLKQLGNPSLLEKIGLVIAKENQQGYYDRFRQRIMFPIHDKRGRVIGFGGRVLDNTLPKYLNSPETPLFHKSQVLYGLYEAKQVNTHLAEILVVEGYMDVVALAQAGITHAVATLGTATTAQHLQQLFQQTTRITFCFDGDQAGRNAAWRALETALPLMQDQYTLRFLFLPAGEDPDSLVRKEGAAAFLQRTQQAMALGEFLLQRLREQYPLTHMENRARFAQEALNYIDKISAPLQGELLRDRVAEMVGIEKNRLLSLTQSTSITEQTGFSSPAGKIQRTPMRLAIALLLQHPNLLHAEQLENVLNFLTLSGSDLLKILAQQIKQQPTLNTATLLELWRDQPESALLHKLAAWELSIPENGLDAEWLGILQSLQQEQRQHDIEMLLQKGRQIPLSDSEKERLQKLLAYKKT